MEKLRLLDLANNPFFAFLFFLSLGIFSFFVLASGISLTLLMQFLAILVLLLIVSLKFILPKLQQPQKIIAWVFGLLLVVLFVYFLIFSTGGLGSPFLILTHFLSIGLAFLLSPQLAVSFISATVLLVIGDLKIDQSAVTFLTQTPFAAFLYFVAYIALIPFSYILAKEYKVKEEWAQILEKQIATSKTQEEELLKNITDAVIVLDNKFNLVYQNQSTMGLLGYGKEILGQDFFKFFSFKDKDGRTLESYALPFDQTLSLKVQSIVENIQIQGKETGYIRVDIKILPVIGAEGPLGLVLVVRNRSEKELAIATKGSISALALGRFLSFLTQQKQIFFDLEKDVSEKERIENLIRQNEELEHLAQDFIYAQRLESGEIGTLWTLCDLGKVAEELVLTQKSLAEELGVKLVTEPFVETEQAVQPKANIVVTDQKGVFPTLYVLGNINWINDSLKRILELALLLCQKGEEVKVEAAKRKDVAQVRIFSSGAKNLGGLAPDLFEKFHGRLESLPELVQTTGLEGYIAKNLIERMGGSLSIETLANPPILIFSITFGLKKE
jgi:signal transduction histidine kinase